MVLALPEGPCAELVEVVWASKGEGCFEQEEILPRTRTEVLFPLGEKHWLRDAAGPGADRSYEASFVSGLQQTPLRIESPADASMAGVRLRPAGAAAFLRDSPAAIAGAVLDLDAILGPAVERLRQQIGATRDLRRRALLLAEAVARHLAPARPISPAVRAALHALDASRGRAAIRDLVRDTGFSHRWLTERFRAEIGVTPKAYARIARFAAAFERLQTLDRVSWADFALAAGYYDQAHLTREFRALAGTTPTDLFRRLAPDGLGLVTSEDDSPH
jgi:AraC-like DNA-binding protein